MSFFTKVKANLFGGYLADQYILYDFKHNDKKDYLSEFDWYRSRYINEPFDFAMNNKIVCNEILKQYVNVPQIYVIKQRGITSTFGKGVVSYEEIADTVKEAKLIFIKPYGMGKGNGVNKIEYSAEKDTFFMDEVAIKEDDLIGELQKRDNWLICQGAVQHEYSSKLYDKTFNTIRMIILRDPETKEFKIFFAVQRIGTKETIPVDNGSKGGLVCKIDLDTGALSEARSLHSLEVHEIHPDSKAPIKGVKIPGWEEIKKEMLRVTNCLPYMNFIAWDIIVTPEGLSIIEANTSSGVNIIQLWGGQRRGELGNFYRYHKVIK